MAKNVLENPGRALVITPKFAKSVASRNFKAALSTLPEVINVAHTVSGIYKGKFVYFMLYG